jgi:hypothetical protein
MSIAKIQVVDEATKILPSFGGRAGGGGVMVRHGGVMVRHGGVMVRRTYGAPCLCNGAPWWCHGAPWWCPGAPSSSHVLSVCLVESAFHLLSGLQ